MEVQELLDRLPRVSEEEFRAIRDGVEVRSRLKTEDLRLIRKALVRYVEVGSFREGVRCRDLFNRMLRKVKVTGD